MAAALTHPESTHPMSSTLSPPSEPLTQVLHISYYDFLIPIRYHSGHTINSAEAQALNQLLLENVRNNISKWIKRLNHPLSLEAHEALQSRVYAYAETYQFSGRPSRRPVSAIDAAMGEIAAAQAEREGNEAGYAPDSPQVLLRYRQLLHDPAVRTEARKIVSERARMALTTLPDILGDSEGVP